MTAHPHHQDYYALEGQLAVARQLLTDTRLRLSNFDPLARRVDAFLYPDAVQGEPVLGSMPSRHDDCRGLLDEAEPIPYLLTEYAYGVLRGMDS